jgi:hypothetical protein
MAGRGANADADRRRAFGQYSTDCPAAHRHQSAANLSALREPVRDSISAKRDGAVPGKTLLVAAVMSPSFRGAAIAASPESIATGFAEQSQGIFPTRS